MRKFNITVNGTAYEVEVEEIKDGAPAAAPAPAPKAAPAPKKAAPAAPKAAPQPAAAGTKVNAPMPGTVLSVKVQQGAQVKRGDVLLILEAMKMENEIAAPQDGTVVQVAVQKGASVNTGDLLAVIG